MRIISLLLIIFYISTLSARDKDLEVSPPVFDFGQIYNWDNPPAVFTVTNESKQKILFLPVYPTQNYKVELPESGVLPGQSVNVEVRYYTKETGPFTEKIDVFSSQSSDPITLKIKGEIMSMSPTADMACPTIGGEKNKVYEFYQQVLVVDAKTRKPLEDAEIKWFYNTRTAHKSKTDKQGKAVEEIVLGNYSLLATKDGYEPNTLNGLINRHSGLVIIPLNPIGEEPTYAFRDLDEKKAKKNNAEEGIYYPVKTKKTEKAKAPSKENQAQSQTRSTSSKWYEPSEEVEDAYVATQEKEEKAKQQRQSAKAPTEPVQTRADYSNVRTKDVDLSYYERNKSTGDRDEDADEEYLAKIEALRAAEQEKDNEEWSSPFDNTTVEEEESSEQLRAKNDNPGETKVTKRNENAESPSLQFYNRSNRAEEDVEMDYAAYQAYLDEIRALENKLDDNAEKPDFFEENTTDKAAAEVDEVKETQEVAQLDNKSVAPSRDTEPLTLDPERYASNNILFLIDVSSSMRGAGRLEALKAAMNNLVSVLRKDDYLTIMTYSSDTEVTMDHRPVSDKEAIRKLIDELEAEGWTFGLKGLNNAYDIIHQTYLRAGNNQIIISTDGKFNNPTFSERDLFQMVRQNRDQTKLSVIGFGNDDDAISRMKKLSRVGSGSYIYIEDGETHSNVLIEEIKAQSLIE